MSGKVTSNASPSLGENMPPAMANPAGAFVFSPMPTPTGGGGYGGGKAFGATSDQPFTPAPYQPGPIRTQTERFRGATTLQPPRAGEFYGPVAPTVPTPIPDMPAPIAGPAPIMETPPDTGQTLDLSNPEVSMGFGIGPITNPEMVTDVSQGVFDQTSTSQIPMIQPAGTYTTAQTPNPFSPAPNLFTDIRQY